MKTIHKFVWLAGCLLVAWSFNVSAQQQPSQRRFYLATDFGVALMDDLDLEEFGYTLPGTGGDTGAGRSSATGTTAVVPDTIVIKPGFRFDASGGYEFPLGKAGNCVSAELASGVMVNQIDRIKFISPAVSLKPDGQIYQVPLLANVSCHHHFSNGITPYIGAGGGVIFNQANLGNLDGRTGDESDLDVVPAYQGFVGVQFEMSENTSVGVAYKYLATSAPSWQGVRVGDVRTHTVSLTLTFRF
jgi:opacity protein-like surface antigen